MLQYICKAQMGKGSHKAKLHKEHSPLNQAQTITNI